MRELAGALKSLKAVTAGLEAGVDNMEEGRGHGLGAPYTHVAAAFMEALAAEAEGALKHVLTTFMAHVAERQETVIECFGAFRELPATQRKAKVTTTFNALGVIQIDKGLECWTKGSR